MRKGLQYCQAVWYGTRGCTACDDKCSVGNVACCGVVYVIVWCLLRMKEAVLLLQQQLQLRLLLQLLLLPQPLLHTTFYAAGCSIATATFTSAPACTNRSFCRPLAAATYTTDAEQSANNSKAVENFTVMSTTQHNTNFSKRLASDDHRQILTQIRVC